VPRSAQLVITGIAAVAGVWLLLWPVVAGTLSRPAAAGEDSEEHREKPPQAGGSGLDESGDRA